MPDEKVKDPSRWRAFFQEHSLGRRLVTAFVLLVAFTLFIHFRDARVELLQVDAQAKNYVVAEVDFEFPDEEGTVMMLQQALKDVGPIYMFAPRQIKQTRYDFEEKLISDSWRKELPNVTFEEMYLGADGVQKQLEKIRFTDARTLKKMKLLGIETKNYYEADVSSRGEVDLPSSFWNDVLEQLIHKKQLNPGAAEFIMIYFRSKHWKYVTDVTAQREVRSSVEASVPQKYSKIQAGSRIIDRGETVNESHLAKLQSMKSALTKQRNLFQPLTLLSSLLYASLILFAGGSYLRHYHREIFMSKERLALLATVVILTLVFAKTIEYVLIVNQTTFVEGIRYPIIVPFAALLLCVLLGAEVSLFMSALLSIVIGVSLAVDHNRVVVANFFAGVLTILIARNLRKRKEVFGVCTKVWLSMIPIFFIYIFAQNMFWNPGLTVDLVSSLFFLLLTSILVVGLLPVLESIFGVMTDITLMEYLDPTNDLLRRLSIEAPGTYQHSLVVGSIAEAAASAINANGLFCRVATMYHDIGKLFNPHYFTENQMGGFNIHQLLTPIESTQVIIAHVTEGEALAKKHGLPHSFIDIIRQHHGTTLVYFFYCKQVEQMGGDVDAVDEEQFRYPGPKPKSKESAIIMIADTIEAASRSLEDVNEDTIGELVERLVTDKAEEGQFDECQLTFEELQIVKRAIIKTLAVTRHLRVKYPDKK